MSTAPTFDPTTLVPGWDTYRAWQQECYQAWWATRPPNFLVSATPGAGKTRFALALANSLMRARLVQRVIVVAPTDHLRTQWADAANRASLSLDPTLGNDVGPVSPDFDGYVTTYAQVASKPALHAARARTKQTLVILDEVHHAGDAQTWGEATLEAFTAARYRVSMTGTPWRSSASERIPFVTYEPVPDGAGALMCVPDYTYGYEHALRDRVVRPVMFAAYTGLATWRNNAGEVLTHDLAGLGTVAEEQAAWRTVLNPAGAWIPHVLTAAHERLLEVRAHVMPDAGGLVLASDQDHARAYAEALARVTGQEPLLVLSDEARSAARISEFNTDPDRFWLVAVRMVSEGVDVPRAAVLTYCTSYRTPLFFAQAIGRVVRSRRPGEAATVFVPAVRPLLSLAAEMETERNHVLAAPPPGDGLDLDELGQDDRASSDGEGYEAVSAEAAFAHVLANGAAHLGDAYLDTEAQDYLGLPGLLSPEQTAKLLAARDAEMRRAASRAEDDTGTDRTLEQEAALHEQVKEVRRQINMMVSQYAARTGEPHGKIHGRLHRAVPGPPAASASLDVLTGRLERLRSWLTKDPRRS